jgi:hypothetical protein
MEYRIVEENGKFTPQIKSFIWWITFGYSYFKKEAALKEIEKHYRYVNSKTGPVYHYINTDEIEL